MQKTVTYLFPNADKASSLKVFQDRTTQITGIYFTRDSIKDVESLQNNKNYAIYFLFNNSEEEDDRVYIGQSINGVERIKNHVANKEFWTYCIMFVTDNNSFDKLTIDYLEYEFINRFKKSSFTLTNKDERNNCPNFSIFDKPIFDSFITQIEFLLSTAGIVVSEQRLPKGQLKYYVPSSNKFKGKIYVKDGKFVLCKNSVILRPAESTVNYSGNFYASLNKQIDDYIEDGKILKTDSGLVTTVDLAFSKPSRVATLLSGHNQNGWVFFKGLNELRN